MADLTRRVVLELLAKNRAKGELAAFDRGINRTGRAVKRLAGSMLAMAGVGGGMYMLQRGLRGAISESSKAEETMAKFNTVFRDQATAAAIWAEQFGDKVGRATHDVAEWMAGLQDTFVPLGIARDKSQELSQSLVQLAVDVASFNNKADADVIRDFTSALVGNHETVRKYGIIISESAIKQAALNKGLDKSYKELTDLEKVQLRYTLIMQGTTDAQGDAIRTSDSYANQVKRLTANWKELQAELGGPVMGVLSDILVKINENDEAIKRWASNVAEGAGMVKKVLPIYWLYAGLKIPDLKKQIAEAQAISAKGPGLPEGKLTISPSAMAKIDAMNRYTAAAKAGGAEEVKISEEVKKKILADTREKLASIRSMDYMTRMEKIQNLKAYMAAHSATLDQVEGAEKLLNDELIALQNSRLDAMKVYQAELREDMQNTSLYTSEKFADVARQIEGSMSGAFQSMISDGASWKEAMSNFFTDVGNAFAKMASDMIARAAMAGIMDIFGGRGSMITAGGSAAGGGNPYFLHSGGIAGVDGVRKPVPFGTFIGAPRMHGGGLAGDEVPVVLQKGERIIPKGGGGFPGQQPITVNPAPVRVIIVKDKKEAMIEAMGSEEGQSEIINAVLNSGLY